MLELSIANITHSQKSQGGAKGGGGNPTPHFVKKESGAIEIGYIRLICNVSGCCAILQIRFIHILPLIELIKQNLSIKALVYSLLPHPYLIQILQSLGLL